MKKIIFFLLILLSSCNKPVTKSEILNFNKNLSFDQFKNLVEKYANNTDFPNIDN
tara:strand:+ start:308 stop:472 length:165 start_codon:yes stop_codon:yes gene_type:complete